MRSARRTIAAGLILALSAALVACDWMPGKPDPEERWRPVSEIADFDRLYGQNCAACHGREGREGTAHALNDPLYQALVSDDVLRGVIETGRAGTSMPAFSVQAGGSLTAKQIDLLIAGMRERWAKPQEFQGVELPPYSLADAQAKGSGAGDVARGAEAYRVYCAQCHGEEGGGGEKAGSITDPNYLGLVSDQSLRTTVIVGRADLKKPDYRSNVAGRAMTPQEITDVVAWLASKRQVMTAQAQPAASPASAQPATSPAAATPTPPATGSSGGSQ